MRLIRRLSKGIPVCIDSQFEEALIAGLTEWYNTKKEVKPPLVGPVKLSFDKLLSLRKTYDFRMISILSNGSLSHEDKQSSIQESLDLARKYLDKAVKEYQFKPDHLYLDPIATSLTANINDNPGSAGNSYNTFRIIKECLGYGMRSGVFLQYDTSFLQRMEKLQRVIPAGQNESDRQDVSYIICFSFYILSQFREHTFRTL